MSGKNKLRKNQYMYMCVYMCEQIQPTYNQGKLKLTRYIHWTSPLAKAKGNVWQGNNNTPITPTPNNICNIQSTYSQHTTNDLMADTTWGLMLVCFKQDANISTAHKNMWPNISWVQQIYHIDVTLMYIDVKYKCFNQPVILCTHNNYMGL